MSIGPEQIIHTSRDTARGESGRRRVKKISVEGGRRRYPQITIMLDYNGAEKGCGSAEKGAMMVVTACADGAADAYLSTGSEGERF